MGLNIYFYKSNTKSDNIEEVYRLDNKRNQDRVHKRFDKSLSLLKNLYSMEEKHEMYNIEYIKLIEYLKNNAYFDFYMDGLLVDNIPQKNPTELEEWYRDSFFSMKHKICYHKVYFLYDFFIENEEMVNQNRCWCSRESIEKLISFCEGIIKGTKDDMDVDYPYYCLTRDGKVKLLKDIVRRFKRLLKGLKNDEKIYAIFSF